MYLRQIFIYFLILIAGLMCFQAFFDYIGEQYPDPYSVKLLRNIDRSPRVLYTVRKARGYLIEIFGEKETRSVLKITKTVTKKTTITAEYTVIFASILLFVLFIFLNLLLWQRRWVRYSIQPDDDMASICSRFLMIESAVLRINPHLKNYQDGKILAGTIIKVRNRNFAERDYLDQLRSVLSFETSHFPEK